MTPTTSGVKSRSRGGRSSRNAGAAPVPLQTAVQRLPQVVRALKAMAHPARLRTLAMLTSGELCVCQMTAVLDLATSTVSGHLADLRGAGLVNERKVGKWVHYRLSDNLGSTALIRDVLALLAADHQAGTDAAVVRRVRRIPVETLSGGGFNLAGATGRGQTCCPRGAPSRGTPAPRVSAPQREEKRHAVTR